MAASDPATIEKTYTGCCHCQKHVFRVNLPDLTVHDENLDVQRCDCSFCEKRGIIWAFAKKDQFEFVKGGKADLKGYRFGSKKSENFHCSDCGTYLMMDDAEKSAINIRTIRDVPVIDIPTKHHAAKNAGPAYQTPPPISHDLDKDLGSDQKIYNGSCHCGTVSFALRSGPLEEHECVECDCSICAGNGCIWIYPKLVDVTFSPNAQSQLVRYAFTEPSPKQNGFFSCPTCGITVYEHRECEDDMGLNARLLEVDLKEFKVLRGKASEKGEPYKIRDV